jgi:hypothetical protein
MQRLQDFEVLMNELRDANNIPREMRRAMRMLNLDNPNNIKYIIERRMRDLPAFFDSFNNFMFDAEQTERTERNFAETVGVLPDSWLAYVADIRERLNPRLQQRYQQQIAAASAAAAAAAAATPAAAGGKKSRSKQRGRKSRSKQRGRRSTHKKRR